MASDIFKAMKCYHALSPIAGIKVLDERACGIKKASRLDSWRPPCPLPPLDYGEAITAFTPRRIAHA